jgi:hypothetical protein
MVDFSDVTDEDIKVQWELMCERDKKRFEAFVVRHPAWKDFEFEPEFGTVGEYKQYLYKTIQQYEKEVPFGYDGMHLTMEKLHDNLKGHTL